MIKGKQVLILGFFNKTFHSRLSDPQFFPTTHSYTTTNEVLFCLTLDFHD